MIHRFPRIRVRQRFPKRMEVNVSDEIARALALFHSKIRPGDRIAIGVGSRGISSLRELVCSVVSELRQMGADPFLFPAMGSHGGGTPSGQLEVLASYGITAEALGVEINASMDVQQVGTSSHGIEVVACKAAIEADGILLLNRIKPHTDFFGNYGSGLLKMSVVGLGKQSGATRFHLAAMRFGYEESLLAISKVIRESTPLLGGVALLESESHRIAHIEGIVASDLELRERELLVQAREMMPRLPFDTIDILLIDEIGKDISGAGMDPNVTNRSIHGYSSLLMPPNALRPFVRRIVVRGLTDETHGNAIGIGMADATTQSLVDAMDLQKTHRNALTALTPQSAKIPIVFPTEDAAMRGMLETLPLEDFANARIVRIKNTLELAEMEISPALWNEVRDSNALEVIESATD